MQQTQHIIQVGHNEGFFSCSTVRLSAAINYYNKHGIMPDYIDSTKQFGWYKKLDCPDEDISHEYFVVPPPPSMPFPPVRKIEYSDGHQYTDFRHFDFEGIYPFILKYFEPATLIREITSHMEKKYNLDYENLCVLFYRGNDKSREIRLVDYTEFIDRALKIKDANPNVQFLVQSDETEFIETAVKSLGIENTIVFYDEIRHIPRCDNTVDNVFREDNHIYSKYFLAITIIMSKCKHIICMSGNCSAWIIHYRNNTDNVYQCSPEKKWFI